MDFALIIKIVIFIILALFASWPYFDNFKQYQNALKKWGIGVSILLLLGLGIEDLIHSDIVAKADSRTINVSNDTILNLSVKIIRLTQSIDDIKQNENDRFDKMDRKQDDLDKRQDDKLNALNDKLTISLQENKGRIPSKSDSTH